jgi:regulator of protease activity HflC (stomatin/prohibitin superfamily)
MIFTFLFPFLPFIIVFGIGGLRVINQYEKSIVLTLGKFTSMREPGLRWIFPGIQKMIKVDMRIATVDIPQQEVISKDNVPLNSTV